MDGETKDTTITPTPSIQAHHVESLRLFEVSLRS